MTGDGDAWLIRLSPAEADRAAYAAIDALEQLGVLAAPVPSRDELRRQVCGALREAGYPRAGQADFGWQHHRAVDHGAHMLITCTVSEMWQTMPGQAVRTAVAQHLIRWADTLAAAGLGVVAWGRSDQTEVLIVASDQATANEEARTVAPYLAERNSADRRQS